MSAPPPPQGGYPYGQQPPYQGPPHGGQPGMPPQGTPPQGGGYGYPGGPTPPYGQAPYGQPPQGQPPYGQAPYGGPGMPPQGMAPQGMAPPYGQPAPPPPPPARSGRSTWEKLKMVAGALVLVIGGGAFIWGFFNKEDAEEVTVGDCLQNKGTDFRPDLEQLDCGDPKASHKVLKKVEGTASDSACTGVPGHTATYTMSKKGGSFTLCLAEVGAADGEDGTDGADTAN